MFFGEPPASEATVSAFDEDRDADGLALIGAVSAVRRQDQRPR
jgi:hypothetical protein